VGLSCTVGAGRVAAGVGEPALGVLPTGVGERGTAAVAVDARVLTGDGVLAALTGDGVLAALAGTGVLVRGATAAVGATLAGADATWQPAVIRTPTSASRHARRRHSRRRWSE
jgi:hypothetical protein